MKYAKKLEQGDLIGVAYTNTIRHAIWLGTGKGGNPQFFLLPWSWSGPPPNWEKYYKVEQMNNGGRFYKDYIVRKNDYSIVKISPDELGDEDLDNYLGVVNFLKQRGHIK